MPLFAVITAPNKIELQEKTDLVPKAQEVIVAPEVAGICGTDLSLFSGDYQIPLPLTPGHEFVGKVIEVGKGVNKSWLNKRVTGEINNSCIAYNSSSLCKACRVGLPNHCLKRTVLGIINHDGAFAEQVAIPAGTLHKIPDSIPSKTAVLIEPLAAALQTFDLSPAKPNDAVVVIGCGRLGILIIFAAILKGLNPIAITRSEEKRHRALNFGVQRAFSPKVAEKEIKSLTGGLGADMVIEATGNPDGLSLALNLIRPRGTIALKTTCGIPAKEFNTTQVAVDEICIQGSRCGRFFPAIEILEKHQKQLSSLITSIHPLKDVETAFRAAKTESKTLLEIGSSEK
jgi:threonine dehydrogenase-like Zn-dependent dehydrogenase